MTINNDDASNAMNFLSGPWAFFRRCRIVCQGQVVEDIDDWGRVSEMFHTLSSSDVRSNASIEGMKAWYDGTQETLAASKSRTVSMKLLSGLLSQSKYLPIRYAPLDIELELVAAVGDCVTGSTAWSLSDVQVKCDVCALDNALENSYAEHLLSGKALPINYGTFISQSQVVTASTFSVNISRAVSRLKSLFFTLDGTAHSSTTANLKEFNNFWSPMSVGNGAYDSAKEMELHVQIGSKLYPEYPMRSVSEQFSQLKKSLGIHNSPFHSVDITPDQYRNYKFIAAIDTEKVLDAGFTGLNTRAGDLMTIKCKPVDASGMGDTKPTKLFVTLHSDQILEVRESGITVFD